MDDVILSHVEHQRYEHVRWAAKPDVSGQPKAGSWTSPICGDTAWPLLHSGKPY